MAKYKPFASLARAVNYPFNSILYFYYIFQMSGASLHNDSKVHLAWQFVELRLKMLRIHLTSDSFHVISSPFTTNPYFARHKILKNVSGTSARAVMDNVT